MADRESLPSSLGLNVKETAVHGNGKKGSQRYWSVGLGALLTVGFCLSAPGTALSATNVLPPKTLSLFSLHGDIQGSETRALCLKEPMETPLRAFCFYYFSSSHITLRSDDAGVGKRQQPVKSPDLALSKWLKGIDRSYAVDWQNVQRVLLDSLRTGKAKDTDLTGLLRGFREPWAATLKLVEQDLGHPETKEDFEREVESSLQKAEPAPQPSVPLGPDAKKPSSPDAPLQASFKPVKRSIARVAQRIEDTSASLEEVSLLLDLMLASLALVIVLTFLTFTRLLLQPPAAMSAKKQPEASPVSSQTETKLDRILEKYRLAAAGPAENEPPAPPSSQYRAVSAKGRRLWLWSNRNKPALPSDGLRCTYERYQSFYAEVAEFRASLRPSAGSSEIEEAIVVLDEQLRSEGQSPEGLLEKARALSGLVQKARDARRRLNQIAGSPEETSLEAGLTGVEDRLRALAKEFGGDNAEEATAPVSIQTIACHWHQIKEEFSFCSEKITNLTSQFEVGETEPEALLKSRLDVIERHLLDYQSSLQAIKELGFSSVKLHTAVSSLGQILDDLRKRFGEPDLKPGTVREQLEAFWELLYLSAQSQRDLSPDTYRGGPTKVLEYLIDALREAQGELEQVTAEARSAAAAVLRVLPAVDGNLGQVVTQLVTAYNNERSSQALQLELIEELCRSVRFQAENLSDPASLKALLRDVQLEELEPHRQLRLGLCAALMLWSEEVGQLRQARRGDVITALQLAEIQEALLPILRLLQGRPKHSLLAGLAEGFAKHGFHLLFRSEVLLDTYFRELSLFDGIRETVRLAGATVRSALNRLECKVELVTLLKPAPPGWEKKPASSIELRQVKEVWDRVQPLLEGPESLDPIVDVELFLRWEGGEARGVGRVITLNPGEWRFFEGEER